MFGIKIANLFRNYLYNYHVHSTNCSGTCTVTKTVGGVVQDKNADGSLNPAYGQSVTEKHSSCGLGTQSYTHGWEEGKGAPISIGTSTYSHDYNVCGKNINSIESATIIFN